jgi:hypothetical protein
MAHFYAAMSGNGPIVTRCGTAGSGLWAHLRGWRVGVEIRVDVNDAGEDQVTVYRTSGSKNPAKVPVQVASWTAKDLAVEKTKAATPTRRILPKLAPRIVEA